MFTNCIRMAIAAAFTLIGLAQEAPPQAAHYKLVFHDDFDVWDGRTWSEGIWFSKEHAPMSNIRVASSELTLTWRPSQKAPDTTITTLSRNKRQGTWRYGYYEARMKWDVVTGAWPAFWMIPIQDFTGKNIYAGTKETGEIDIFEGIGSEPRTFFGTIHSWKNGSDNASSPNHFPIPPEANFSQFHIYGLLWEPGRVTWYFDDKALHSEQTPAIVDKQDFFLVLGMQEGIDWKQGLRTGVQAQQMDLKVDWVRVWQRGL